MKSKLALTFLVLLITPTVFAADDWNGPFEISPVSAPDMVLEAVNGAGNDSIKVSIHAPTGKNNQHWVITAKGNDTYTLHPADNAAHVLAAAQGGTASGTLVVLENDVGKPWQHWSLKRNDIHSFSLLPKHALDKALDDFGGGTKPGSKQDIFAYNANDEHLQWTLKALPGATVPAAMGKLELLNVPKGVVKEFTFDASIIFPGTKRVGTVFIPAQYDGTKPACVYVRQDGYNPREKLLLEALIAANEMPVTIAIFIRPGDLPAPMKGTLGRRNRCLEYDGVGDKYVRFLTDELLPFVAKNFELKLSTSGNDRCIAGGSSGAIAAFNAAWERPDAFSRVYAASGSFVAFRGGHEFPTLIRKFEAKPIRAYLTTGTHDMENCAGNWYLLDQEIDKALTFSGYEYFFKAIEGGHVVGMNENFSDAMRYIWKGWPEAVKAGASAPRVRDILTPDSAWTLAGEGVHASCSPVCSATGDVLFIDSAANKIKRIAPDGTIGDVIGDAAQANGLSVGPKGELYTVSLTTGNVLQYVDGKASVYASGLLGHSVLAMPTGGVYVTAAGEKEGSDIWFVKDGAKTRVDSGLKHATGLTYRPDQWLLDVADGASKWIYSYQVNADGSLINKERFFDLHVADWDDDAGAESLCYAKENRLFAATRSGVQVCADDGPSQVILPVPGGARVLGVCLGGPDMNTLYAFCDGKIWKRVVKVHGIGAFTPWTAVKGNPL